MSYKLSEYLVIGVTSRASRPHIFFDDQDVHCKPASTVVPSARVPYKTGKNE